VSKQVSVRFEDVSDDGEILTERPAGRRGGLTGRPLGGRSSLQNGAMAKKSAFQIRHFGGYNHMRVGMGPNKAKTAFRNSRERRLGPEKQGFHVFSG